MRLTIVFSLLALWVFALVTPSILTIVEKSETTFVFNLNEEEQKESIGQDADQKHLYRHATVLLYLAGTRNSRILPENITHLPNPLFEIFLPPPEGSSLKLT